MKEGGLDRTVNRLSLRVPIDQLMQSEIIAKLQEQVMNKATSEQAIVAFKINKQTKKEINLELKPLFRVEKQGDEDVLLDNLTEYEQTKGDDPYPYKIKLFDENKHNENPFYNINE